jgi:hypothetical protein
MVRRPSAPAGEVLPDAVPSDVRMGGWCCTGLYRFPPRVPADQDRTDRLETEAARKREGGSPLCSAEFRGAPRRLCEDSSVTFSGFTGFKD